MPEMRFHVRWPDGTEEACYSPSLVVHDHLTAGTDYPVEEFVARSRAALDEASERVRARFGMGCTASMAQLQAIEERAAGFDGGDVHVVRLDPPTLPG